jgi:hypothetical protein
MKIIRNSATCTRCGDELESKHRHDFVRCSCGAIFIDGGHAYFRAGGNPGDLIDTSITEDDDE